MHVHVSVLDAIIVGAYMLIWMYLFRLVATKYSDTPVGKALAFIH